MVTGRVKTRKGEGRGKMIRRKEVGKGESDKEKGGQQGGE